jgi:hypothetical protein
MRRIRHLTALLLFSAAIANAQVPRAIYDGVIGGTLRVQIELEQRDSTNIAGTYRYRGQHGSLRLDGTIAQLPGGDASTLVLSEREIATTAPTGAWHGTLSADGQVYSGEWSSADGSRRLPFTARRIVRYEWLEGIDLGYPDDGSVPIRYTVLYPHIADRDGSLRRELDDSIRSLFGQLVPLANDTVVITSGTIDSNAIADVAAREIDSALAEAPDTSEALDELDETDTQRDTNERDHRLTVVVCDEDLVTIHYELAYDEYHSGIEQWGVNFAVSAGRPRLITLSELFRSHSNYRKELTALLMRELRAYAFACPLETLMVEVGATDDGFGSFLITHEGLLFSMGWLGPTVCGPAQEILIRYEEIASLIDVKGPLGRFLSRRN